MDKKVEKLAKKLDKYHYRGYNETVNDAIKILEDVWHILMDKGEHSGMSASFVDIGFIGKTRDMERFRIVDYNDYLYPQNYHNFLELATPDKETMDWLKGKATEKLAENKKSEFKAHKDVKYWWEQLAKGINPSDIELQEEKQ